METHSVDCLESDKSLKQKWRKFDDYVCYLRLPGTVLIYLLRTQEIVGVNSIFYKNILHIL